MAGRIVELPINYHALGLRCPECFSELVKEPLNYPGGAATLKCDYVHCSLYGQHYEWPTIVLKVREESEFE